MSANAKASKGTVGVQSVDGRLQWNLPRQWFNGKQQRPKVGLPDTSENRREAEKQARQMEIDYLAGVFDPSFVKYRPWKKLTVVDADKPKTELTLFELWKQFTEYKSSGDLSPCTLSKYRTVASHIDKVGIDGLADALKFRFRLFQVTSSGQARESLKLISAACKWGLQHKLVASNPFDGMYREVTQPEPQSPVSFTVEQRDLIISTFENHKGNWNGRGYTGVQLSLYAPFIKFLFYTGCRPSEAIGLRWESISPDCTEVRFHESIVCVDGHRLERRNRTKTNRDRTFNCTDKLKELLLSIKPKNLEPDSLVFVSPRGNPINEANFNQRVFTKVLKSLNLACIEGKTMTLYNCRDTFISLQASANVSTTVIANWVGNSPKVVEERYLDKSRLQNLKPQDI